MTGREVEVRLEENEALLNFDPRGSGHNLACLTWHAIASFPGCPSNLIKGKFYFCDKWG